MVSFSSVFEITLSVYTKQLLLSISVKSGRIFTLPLSGATIHLDFKEELLIIK